MNWSDCPEVETVDGKLAGAPILVHSRVPVQAVIDSAGLGETAEEIAYSFSLPAERVRKVLEFAALRSVLKPSA
jgi:uncharacterized protein (DUF433 family)